MFLHISTFWDIQKIEHVGNDGAPHLNKLGNHFGGFETIFNRYRFEKHGKPTWWNLDKIFEILKYV